ncbi:hypothetical protein [Paraburkholderia unamae]|uniref:hypothetical protein n=1 Tax=Paraburkholderia unamae TaxID=219649 RepID=UPI000E3089BB|nr:hypothetical protein [Paraburkholderia unamae]
MRLDVDAFPSGLAAVVSKCATPAMLDFASALEAQIARRTEASSAPNVVGYEAGSAASSSADAFDGQLSFLRDAGRAIAAGVPQVRCRAFVYYRLRRRFIFQRPRHASPTRASNSAWRIWLVRKRRATSRQ